MKGEIPVAETLLEALTAALGRATPELKHRLGSKASVSTIQIHSRDFQQLQVKVHSTRPRSFRS